MHHTSPFGAAALGLAAVLAMAAPAAADLVSGVGAIPNPFSPNGDGVYDRTAVHYTLSDSATVAIVIADSTMAELVELWSGEEPAGLRQHFWDGSIGEETVPDGDYYFLIDAIALAGGVDDASFRFTVDTVPPVVSRLDVIPSRFTPDGDGVGDSLSISFELEDPGPADVVTITVFDAGSSPVRSFVFGAGAGSGRVSWDGTDSSGSAQEDGLYFVSLEAVDPAGNSSTDGSLVELDTSPPAIGIDYTDEEAAEIRVEDASALVRGWAYDRAGVAAVEISIDGETWSAAAVTGEDTVRWESEVECSSCVPDTLDETIELQVRARDGAITAGGGHVNTESTDPPIQSADLIFDVAGPLHVESAVSDEDNVYYSGQTISISSEWDQADYDITADFGGVDSDFDPESVEVEDAGGGVYTITYAISVENTLPPVSDVPVPILAIDEFGREASDASVAVTVLEGAGVATFLSVDRNSFDPTEGEGVTVSFGTYEGDVSISVYNMAGTLVRTIDGTDEDDGEYAAFWNGRNGEGDIVASGVYFMDIETDNGGAIRKIAVIK